jgi:hypothetical protein
MQTCYLASARCSLSPVQNSSCSCQPFSTWPALSALFSDMDTLLLLNIKVEGQSSGHLTSPLTVGCRFRTVSGMQAGKPLTLGNVFMAYKEVCGGDKQMARGTNMPYAWNMSSWHTRKCVVVANKWLEVRTCRMHGT